MEWTSLNSFSISDAPRLKLSLGRTLNASNLKENDDVYFECAVDARPTPKEIEWRHNVSLQRYSSAKLLGFAESLLGKSADSCPSLPQKIFGFRCHNHCHEGHGISLETDKFDVWSYCPCPALAMIATGGSKKTCCRTLRKK